MLQTKASLRTMPFLSAFQLYHAIIIPAATYGLSLFSAQTDENTYVQHIEYIASYYWKKWAQLPNNSPTTRLLTGIIENDHLNIQKSKYYWIRRRNENNYTNGSHVLLCHKTHCYKLKKHEKAERGFTAYKPVNLSSVSEK